MDFPELLVFQALLVCQELKEMPVYPVSVDLVHKVLREKQACQVLWVYLDSREIVVMLAFLVCLVNAVRRVMPVSMELLAPLVFLEDPEPKVIVATMDSQVCPD